MASEAAVGYAIYEVAETVVEIGVGAYFVAKPTMPLKARLTQIAASTDDSTRLSLARSDHTLSVVGSKAYIFGGETASSKLASNKIQAVGLDQTEKLQPEYSVIPAVAKTEGGNIPVARTKHSACTHNASVAIYGGISENGQVVEENSTIWLFHTEYQYWDSLDALNRDTHAPQSRSGASLSEFQGNLYVYGGFDAEGNPLKDVWKFDYAMKTWGQLPDAPVSTPNVALSGGVLHLISSGGDSMTSDLHILPLVAKTEDEKAWHTIPFPTNPLTPGPLPRTGAGLLPVSTGYGRQYLLYLFGAQTSPASTEGSSSDMWSDMWTYQLPSSTPEVSAGYDAMKPAKIKDAIRSALGVDSGKHSWSEVEVMAPGDLAPEAGKLHPGPRTAFACDVMKDKKGAVIWGGVNPKGEREGDGWVIRLE